MKVTNKEAYFLSLYGLIQKQHRKAMEPLLATKFSKELKNFFLCSKSS